MLLKEFATFTCLIFVVSSSLAEQNFPPNFSDRAKAAFNEKYEPASRDKAFAVTSDGSRFFYVYDLKTSERAARTASLRCLSTHGELCFVWKINGDDVLGDYEKAKEQSDKALAALPTELSKKAYADEDSDMGVVVPQTLREGSEIHAPTPSTMPSGSKIISTLELVKLFKSEPKLVVLDSNHANAAKKPTLPKANWLHGSGWAETKFNKTIDTNFAKVMAGIAPNKNTPIVSYCSNWECWLSWNTTMRLSALGYTNLYWYRGGIDAWRAAKLPVIETPITAQLW
jgi:PQQ-dependent catabolism-associated CXXCW motif protein